MSEELKNMSAGQAEEQGETKAQALAETELNQVAGGQTVQTAKGTFVNIPDDAKFFNNRHDAEVYEQGVKDCREKFCRRKRPHHHNEGTVPSTQPGGGTSNPDIPNPSDTPIRFSMR